MSPVSSIPTSRVSELLIGQRVLSQLRADQQALFRVQDSISTGFRIQTPSDDAPAAVRAMGLQQLIERKEQVKVNLSTNQSFLTATDTALAEVRGLLNSVLSTSIAAASSTTSDSQRLAAAQEVRGALDQILNTSNQKFRDRYLFAGSTTNVRPFEANENVVRYHGNEEVLRSYSDLDLLFETNVHGNDVFGAISDPVRGAVDLNPIITFDTRLSDLHGGDGVNLGSIQISDGTNSSTIDLSGAETMRDVVDLLVAQPPPGRALSVTVTPQGLNVALDSAGGGELTVREVAGGTVATELGILQPNGTGSLEVLGEDLRPRLTPTTPLRDILGTRPFTRLAMSGANNDLLIEANERGLDFNGYSFHVIDDNALQASQGIAGGGVAIRTETDPVAARTSLAFNGSNNDLILTANTPGTDFNNVRVAVASNIVAPAAPPTAVFDQATNTLSINLRTDGTTTANEIIAAIAIEPSGNFTASLDDSLETTNDGSGTVGVVNDPEFASTGNSGGAANTVFIHVQNGVTTSSEIAEAINTEGTFSATFDPSDNPLIADAGTGLVDLASTATTAGGTGVEFDQASGLQILNGDETHVIDIAAAETIEDVINILNGSPAGVVAEINAAGNGLDIRSLLSGTDFAIGENGGTTATELGIRSFSTETRLDDLNYGFGVHKADGVDFTIQRRDGVELEIELGDAKTVGEVLEIINTHPDNQTGIPLTATLARFGNGIELVHDDPAGTEPLVVRRAVLGQAAQDLGLVPSFEEESLPAIPGTIATAQTALAGADNDLVWESALPGAVFNDVSIIYTNFAAVGDQAFASYDALDKTLTIDIDPAATTANTVIAAVATEGTFVAQLDETSEPGNTGAGLIAFTGEAGQFSGGTAETLTGRDTNPQETKGVFNSLVRLSLALESGNSLLDIDRAAELLRDDLTRLDFVRAEVGTRQQSLDVLEIRVEDEEIILKQALSSEIEVDLVEAISTLSARQASFEASLQSTAAISQLSLLDFL